jgi:hypothetical protein
MCCEEENGAVEAMHTTMETVNCQLHNCQQEKSSGISMAYQAITAGIYEACKINWNKTFR